MDRPHLNTAAFEFGVALVARKFGAHEKDVAIRLSTRFELGYIVFDLMVVSRMDYGTRFRTNHIFDDAHYVQWPCRVSTRREIEPFGIWMKLQQLLRRRDGDRIRPRLIYLFHEIERLAFNRMETNGLEFHALQHVERITDLGSNPIMHFAS
jgi:hypothetical protein